MVNLTDMGGEGLVLRLTHDVAEDIRPAEYGFGM